MLPSTFGKDGYDHSDFFIRHESTDPIYIRKFAPSDKILECINATRYSDLVYQLSYMTVKWRINDEDKKIRIGDKENIK